MFSKALIILASISAAFAKPYVKIFSLSMCMVLIQRNVDHTACSFLRLPRWTKWYCDVAGRRNLSHFSQFWCLFDRHLRWKLYPAGNSNFVERFNNPDFFLRLNFKSSTAASIFQRPAQSRSLSTQPLARTATNTLFASPLSLLWIPLNLSTLLRRSLPSSRMSK